MISLLAIPLIILSDITLRVAPERALAITYSDEPVVVQINDVPAGDYRASGTIHNPQGDPFPIDIPKLSIASSTPYYLSVFLSPDSFGPHTLSLKLSNTESQFTADTIFYRNHRPNHQAPTPLSMTFPTWQPDSFTVALEVPLKEARIFLDTENAAQAIQDLSTLNTHIRAVVNRAEAPATEAQLESWVALYNTRIDTWEFDLAATPQHTITLIQLLRQLQPNANIALRTRSTESLAIFLATNTSIPIHDIVLTESTPDVYRYRSIAQQAGLETTSFSVECLNTSPEDSCTQLTSPMSTFSPVTLDIPSIDTSTPAGQDTLSLFNHWAEALPAYEAIGPYYIDSTVNAQLYRSRIPDSPWLMAISADSPQTLVLPESLQPYTALSHRLAPIRGNNKFELPIGTTLVFLSGSDPTPIAQALCNTLIQESTTLLAISAYTEVLPEDIQNTIRAFMTATPETSFRTPFLTLIRQFPEIESRYHTGEIPREVAIPLMARLTYMTRLIAALEELIGTPFLESPTTTLAKCNDFLAQYHSRGISTAPYSRETRLLTEINRLMTEAKSLDSRALTIEATAVATIAEWRTRALLKRTETATGN